MTSRIETSFFEATRSLKFSATVANKHRFLWQWWIFVEWNFPEWNFSQMRINIIKGNYDKNKVQKVKNKRKTENKIESHVKFYMNHLLSRQNIASIVWFAIRKTFAEYYSVKSHCLLSSGNLAKHSYFLLLASKKKNYFRVPKWKKNHVVGSKWKEKNHSNDMEQWK